METEKDELRKILDEILAHENTLVYRDHRGNRIIPENLCKQFATERKFNLKIPQIKIEIGDDVMTKHHVDFFEKFFENYVNDQGKLGVFPLLRDVNDTGEGVLDFVKDNVMRATALLGPAKVAELLFNWKNIGRYSYLYKLFIRGVSIKTPIKVTDSVEFLPATEENIDSKVFEDDSELRKIRSENNNDLVISIKNEVMPVFHKHYIVNNRSIASTSMDIYTGDWYQKYLEFVLSLTFNHFVCIDSDWLYDDISYAFTGKCTIRNERVNDFERQFLRVYNTISRENIGDIMILMNNCAKAIGNSPDLLKALGKWHKNKILGYVENHEKLVDLRYISELLFCGGKKSISHDVKDNSTKFLFPDDIVQRQEMQKEMEDFYSIASNEGVHPKTTKKKRLHNESLRVDNDYINRIQDIFREALLKMIQTGGIPIWNPKPLIEIDKKSVNKI